ncbi:unnamed protein product [Mytilus edulis]|uniref:Uncharacterized protein n=1 Tax=Mytilus edulis TaxID=6550 RepID=A0A8S3SD88_MYTED|nr:unnamed protein product [Mytilus edulis]
MDTFQRSFGEIPNGFGNLYLLAGIHTAGSVPELYRKLNMQGIQDQQIQPYTLGQSIYVFHHQTDLTSAVGVDDRGGHVTDIVMMDDGRLVMCLPKQKRLVICNTDGSELDGIDVQNVPWFVTAANASTVAVTLKSVQPVQTDRYPEKVNGSGDRIFYCDNYYNNQLYCNSYTDDTHHALTLPSAPMSMTTLQDGSLYVGV